MFSISSIFSFYKNILYKCRYHITENECKQAVLEVCDFFGIPEPLLIKDITDHPELGTCIMPRDTERLDDDLLLFDLKELKQLGVEDIIGFKAVMTHECAHRVFQNQWFPGPDMGQWEGELIADYFMGIHAGLKAWDISTLINALASTGGSGSHPSGKFRKEYVQYGLFEARRHLIQRKVGTIGEYFQLFIDYRNAHLKELRQAELMIY